MSATAVPMPISVAEHPLGIQDVCVTVAGEIDIATIGAVRQAIVEAVHGPRRRLLVDLERVTFADTSLVHALEMAEQLLGPLPGGMLVVAAGPPVARLLRLCELDPCISVLASFAEARARLRGEPPVEPLAA
jgi:anti-anti-sigma factor